MAIKLYQSQTSMFCEKVRVVLAMKNLPYEIVDVRKDDRKSLIEYSKQRKVPVMDYNGECVLDSTYIAAFLEDKHPEQSIYPDGIANRGLCLMLEDWADEVLNRAVVARRRADSMEDKKRAEADLSVYFRSLNQLFTEKKFIFDRLTIADIAIFTQLHYLYTVGQYQIPATYPNLLAWMDLCRETLKLNSLSESFVAGLS